MKQTHVVLLLVVGIVLCAMTVTAQPLSGDYYIGARTGSAPGGADPDFATLALWRTRLVDTTNSPIAGPCTFYLLDSAYTISSATLSRLYCKGSSATNTIVLKPYTGVQPVITFATESSSSTGQIQFGDEAMGRGVQPQYFTIDGSNTVGGTTRDLTINFFGQTGMRVFVDCRHITIKNLVINKTHTGATTSSTNHCVLFSSQNRTAAPVGWFTPDSSLVENCVLNNYSTSGLGRGIGINVGTAPADSTLGSSGIIIRNNVISASERGIYVTWVKSAEIYGNRIRVNQAASRDAAGIFVEKTGKTGTGTVNVYNNVIDTLTTANVVSATSGLSGIYVHPATYGTVTIKNNFIAGFATPATSAGFVRGLSVDSCAATVNAYHNSINIPTQLLTGYATGVLMRGSPTVGPTLTLKNNIVVVNEDDDTTYCISRVGTTGTLTSDWNVLYAGGLAKVGSLPAGESTTLTDWKTASGQDANSKSANPAAAYGGAGQWKSAVDLHFFSQPASAFGAPQVGGVTTDIDGETRGATAYIGADEIPGSPLAVGNEGSRPDAYELSQNYPNPFNPSTVISFKLLSSSRVSLKVYDLLGCEVATLLNEQRSAGTHRVTFNAAGLSSGVYFYTLTAGDFRATRRMIIVK